MKNNLSEKTIHQANNMFINKEDPQNSPVEIEELDEDRILR